MNPDQAEGAAGDKADYDWPLPRRRCFSILDATDVLCDFERISCLPVERNTGHLLGI